MAALPVNHPERFLLADEVHARPPVAIEAPARASYVAVLIDADDRTREHAHLVQLCERFAAAPPLAAATHHSVRLSAHLHLKWERHGEFSGYTFFTSGAAPAPFTQPAVSLLPPGWIDRIPGSTIAACHIDVVRADAVPDTAALLALFPGLHPVGAEVADGAALAYTDFRIQDDGYGRVLVVDRGLSPRQAGRLVQRLFEIEAYRMLALLALPIARRQSPRILAIERSLAELTDGIARGEGDDEALLHELTRLAAEVESGLAASQFRFGACRAYYDLVRTRIGELREARVSGFQSIDEFMSRRLTPAVATCTTVSQRLQDLSERVAQASALLSTRVDIARERQNQALLASMDRRARLQLRLQETVEGLSVAAITYYSAGVMGYIAKAAHALGAPINPEVVVGVMIPFIAVLVIWAVRRARQRIVAAEDGASSV
ncbi:MAG: DUF3422 domain-containing protein [Betaproteobacteria bacterium]|nr:DUF3422 domain-containing protein [Betaproteobacteria bacterium]